MSKPNREIKSSVFADLFQNCSMAKENALSLYNGLNGTNLTDPGLIQHIEIDESIYRSIKNDVAFQVDNKIVMLVEHQSTVNPNMPLRMLMYLGKVYEKLIDQKLRYSRSLVHIPVPEIYVLYNGSEKFPEEKTLKLSDAFIENIIGSIIEIEVKIININYDEYPDSDILNNCAVLKEYSEFIDIYKKYVYMGEKEPAKRTINECINKGILADYLKKAGDEIMSFLTAEYDYETDIQVNREESYKEGVIAGIEQGQLELITGFMKTQIYSLL